MLEHRKINRILQLIARLRSPIGCTKDELARDFEVSARTIERHLKMLEDIGFKVDQHENRFYITNINRSTFKQEDLIVFNLEEASLIKEALLNNHVKSAIYDNVLDKLYALTDLDSLAETIGKSRQSFIIGTIRQGIKHKLQVVLKAYDSQNSSKTGNRLIEPIRFHNYFVYLTAFEIETAKIKIFKTERIGDAILTEKSWKYEAEHHRIGMDIFGMAGEIPIPVKLKLSKRAKNLLEEEYTDAAKYIHMVHGNYYLDTEVYQLEGIGRFVMGLPDEIEIIEPQQLKDYIRIKIESFVLRH
ncbi:MAG: WYL domain-containing protein [Bacteroidales bacterium]|nr:WYL domain-containing protein [Bacteroidales bacterium]